MPIIIERADCPLWLGETEGNVAGLMRAPDDALRIWSVDTKVGNVRKDTPEQVVPAEALLL
jgi:putative SOS response-associated peptidase YedK